MDIRANIIQNVIKHLTGRVDDTIVNAVQDILTIELNNYEIQERCTDLVVHDNSNESILKKFAATKRVEGTSESTLKRYMEQNITLINFIGKPLNEITTYDIRFYLSVKRERDLALVEFLYCTGCRVTEVSNLNIADVDFDTMQCTVLGKGNKERIVYLTEVATMYLQEYLSTRKYLSEVLFAGKGGKRLSKNGIEVLLKRLGEKANVENVHPHRYRRTLATNLLDHGMNIQDVATILGHSDLKTTQVYCYISQKNVQSAYKKFAS